MTVTALSLVVACGAILDIKDAETDPLLGVGGGGGDGNELCEEYCSTVQAECEDGEQVYTSEELCLLMCPLFPEGEPDAENGNSIQCRLTAAKRVARLDEPLLDCPIAGPGGENDTGIGSCGTQCDAYCMLFEAACEDEFIDRATCMNECEALDSVGSYNVGIIDGDSIECRLYHVSAATDDPSQHCSHAAGESPCIADGGGGAGGN